MNEHPTDIVKPYYHYFMEKKVLHTSIESVAGHLNSVRTDLWWDGIKRSEEYIGYKNRFAGE